MNTKSLTGVEVKDADKGTVTAVFSTFDVIDKDGDVTRPGAFEDGAPVRVSAYGHASWSGALPVGKGTIKTTKSEAVADLGFFMDTTPGRDTFLTVKQLGDLGEWSYGFDIMEESKGKFEERDVRFLTKLKVHEVSPVLLGAGVNTRTLVAKSAGLRFPEEATAVLAAVMSLLDRADDVVAHRREKGKQLGTESAALLEQIEASLKRFDAVLRAPDPEQVDEEVLREFLHYQQSLSALT